MEDVEKILPWWSISFFILLLLSIAILPLTRKHWWENNRNKAIISAILSIPVLVLFWHYHNFGPVIHEIGEYLSFMILLGSLFIVSGGIFLSGEMRPTPGNNTVFLTLGGIIANIFGTTGAAMLLIRTMIRMTGDRKYVAHIPVFFIFIVCNIGGMLTPIGDPPLFMGYLRGVPFFWTLRLFPYWVFSMAATLIAFYLMDRYLWQKEPAKFKALVGKPFEIHGLVNVAFIAGIVLSVIFLDAPAREAAMIALSLMSLLFTPDGVRKRNEFNYHPIIEVAVLFAGIFITVTPVLLIMGARGSEFGIRVPWHLFWVTGGLSSFLDNTPTYVTFLSLTQGLAPAANLPNEIIGIPAKYLEAISVGAVCMGANTYIGNGPNFMVKAICESQKIKMPSFFGFMVWSGAILIPIFILMTLVFFR